MSMVKNMIKLTPPSHFTNIPDLASGIEPLFMHASFIPETSDIVSYVYGLLNITPALPTTDITTSSRILREL